VKGKRLMKKYFILSIACLMMVPLFSACNNGGSTEPVTDNNITANQDNTPVINEEEEIPEPEGIWVGTWASAQYYGDDTGDGGKLSALNVSKTLPGATLRQIIRTSTGGEQLRLTFSNEYGTTDLTITATHIAKATEPAKSGIDVSTDTVVTFNGGETSIVIPAGEFINSDPIDFPVSALERIAISTYFGEMPELVSSHIAARANSFVQEGNVVSEAVMTGTSNTHWFVLCNVDILSSEESRSIVAFGDSITDGFGVRDEQYTRWVDILMNNFQENPATKHLSVINMGIGTNSLLNQRNPAAGVYRFERDVLNQPGVGYVILLIGVNDLNAGRNSSAMIMTFDSLITQAREQGIKVLAGTIMPHNASNDHNRQTINNWMREQYAEGNIHGLIDFDELMKDPDNPSAMKAEYNQDGLHPSIAGYAAMGEYAYSVILNYILKEEMA
jgi:lysophospholipase L1-like esterase